ncbi:aminodeoxychorismate lyase [Antrihabitans stalactiti]|uniref:Aminodeoxychorismate lyase n=1 Tax=Antrihabitans stalactiti TaxID=2584121 RepID=A0A848KHA9_9NOCA|nr:aminodeoxychorismate lyase [Antrihabitans stalactiti]NMN97128.1 aminodeoxychorismate lyase [Antrihabitans stalactiti]
MADRVLVTLDGVVRDADQPLLCADDLAALRGDGAFETILVRGGRARIVDMHLARLSKSAEALDLPAPDLAAWRSVIDTAAEEWGEEAEGAMRVVYSRGREGGGDPTGYVLIGPVQDRVRAVRTDGVSVMTMPRGQSVDLGQIAPWQLVGAKTLSYATNMAALRFAARYGADDVIFVSSEGRVLEGPRSTVVIARDKSLITPPASQGVLAGTTQRALFQVAEDKGYSCEYAPLFPADLITADGVWLLSSVTLAARVHTIDGLELPEPENSGAIPSLVDLAVESVT